MARPRDSAIDERVVDACVALLGEVGRAGLSRAAVARRAGVSLPAVHRRFTDVDAILLAVASSPHERVRELDPVAPAADLRTWLVDRLTRTVAVMAAEPALRRQASELMAAASGNAVLDATLRASLGVQREDGVRAVEAAKATGEVCADVDADVLLDLIASAAYYRLIWRDEVLPESEVESVVDLLLDGATPR